MCRSPPSFQEIHSQELFVSQRLRPKDDHKLQEKRMLGYANTLIQPVHSYIKRAHTSVRTAFRTPTSTKTTKSILHVCPKPCLHPRPECVGSLTHPLLVQNKAQD
jgi:hypothetical protein